jgi:hypothetical protein
MTLHRAEQELEDRTSLLGAGGDHCPDMLIPPNTINRMFAGPGFLANFLEGRA